MEDAFDCFGSDDSDEDILLCSRFSDVDADADANADADADADADVDSRRRIHLRDQANASMERMELANQQRASAVDRLPIRRSQDFEVFEDDATTTSSSSSNNHNSDTTPSNTASRGKGLRAMRSYNVGDEILREAAVMRIPNQQAATTWDEATAQHYRAISKAFEALSPATQRAYQQLSVCDQWKHLDHHLGVFQTNSYQLRGETDGGVFLTTSRINHSCRPNANPMWRADLQQQLIFCCAPIEKGQEILVSYGPSSFSSMSSSSSSSQHPQYSLDTKGRRDFLREKFSFECHCDMCVEGNTNGGDDRMKRIERLRDEISFPAKMATATTTTTLRSNCNSEDDSDDDSDSDSTLHQKVQVCLTLLQEQGLGSSWGSFTSSLLRAASQNTSTSTSTSTCCNNNNVSQKTRRLYYLTQELALVQQLEGMRCPRAEEIQYQLTK